MLQKSNWKLRANRLYGIRGDRSPLVLCRDLTFPLIRIESAFRASQSVPRAGTIQQFVGSVYGEKRIVPLETRYYVYPVDLVPYSLYWAPIASLPLGYLQVWEYCGPLSVAALNQFISFSNGDSMPLYRAPQNESVPDSATTQISTVAASTTAVELLPANEARKMFSVYNASTSKMYVSTDGPASSENYVGILYSNDVYEPPINFTGPVSGIWETANGSAKSCEFF